jgi:acyl carrier protein
MSTSTGPTITRHDVVERLTSRLADVLEIDRDEITDDTLLLDDLDADSLDLLELVLALKDDFDITVHDGEVKALLADLARFLPESERILSEDPLTDGELAEVTRRLRVGTIADFVNDRLGV